MAKEKYELKVSAVITKSQRATIERISKEIKQLNGVDISKTSIVRAVLEAMRLYGIKSTGVRTERELVNSVLRG